jgi:hypothetical protein
VQNAKPSEQRTLHFSRGGKSLIALQVAGLAFGASMMCLGGMCGFPWPIGVAAGMGAGFTAGLGLANAIIAGRQ